MKQKLDVKGKEILHFIFRKAQNFTFLEKHKLCQIDLLSNQEIGVKPKLQWENLSHLPRCHTRFPEVICSNTQ